MAWTPPKNDTRNVGAFVAQNYGKKSAAFQQRLYRKLLGKGYEYYRPNDSSPYARVTDPMKRAKPMGWGEGPNIIGSWDKKPNLDSSQYQIGQNEVGKFYARPHDIKNYLDGAQMGLLRNFEEKASAANAPVEKAYSDYQQAAQASADQIGAQNKAAQDLMARTYSGAGTGDAQQQAQTDAAAYGAAALPSVNSWAAMPTVAAQNKANALASVKQQVDDARREMLMNMYAQVQEERIAKARNAAEIRMAQMQNLAEANKLAQQGEQFDKELAQQLTISREGNAVDLARIQASAAAAAAGSGSTDDGTPTAKDYKKWRAELRKRMKGTTKNRTEYLVDYNGVPTWAYVNDDGYVVDSRGYGLDGVDAKTVDKGQKRTVKKTDKSTQTGWGELLIEGISEGYTAPQVVSALMIANPALRKMPKWKLGNVIYGQLRSAYGDAAATKYVKAAVPGWKG